MGSVFDYGSSRFPFDSEWLGIVLAVGLSFNHGDLLALTVRKPGGGRKACIESIVGIDDLFLKVVNTPPAKDRWLQVTAESRIVSPKGDL